jgi:hypothetical protein
LINFLTESNLLQFEYAKLGLIFKLKQENEADLLSVIKQIERTSAEKSDG